MWRYNQLVRSWHNQTCFCIQALTILSFFSFLLLIVPPHLQPQADPFGDCRLGERGLDHWHQFTCQRASLRSNQVALLLDTWHDGKVKGEVGGDDPTDSLLAEFFLTLEIWGDQREGLETFTSWRLAEAAAWDGAWQIKFLPSSIPLRIVSSTSSP